MALIPKFDTLLTTLSCTLSLIVHESMGDAFILKGDLDRLIDWSQLWQMSFNPDKCNSSFKKPSSTSVYSQGTLLESVDHHPYLGIELSSNLDWGKHISNIVGKANRTLGFVRRYLGRCTETVKSQAYTTPVRPRLQYASSAWDPIPRNT